ncbi:MAG: peptide-methionine (S)-S-oxide reductase [Lentisphaeraceae bacterium]|nr:peptide-methionine (S)-S-oxide reductase [Lentisphaeraceae bacterium]
MHFLLKISLFLLLLAISCSKPKAETRHQAVFGAGCFWVLDYYFQKIDGVFESKCIYTESGSEAVLLSYNPQKVSFSSLCEIFLELHDPSTDFKPQYKSLIQTDLKKNRDLAQKMINRLRDENEVKTVIQNIGKYSFPDAMHEDWHLKKIQSRSVISRTIL